MGINLIISTSLYSILGDENYYNSIIFFTMSEEQEVKIATKKILQTLLLYFGLIFLIMWVLFPVDSIYNLTICGAINSYS